MGLSHGINGFRKLSDRIYTNWSMEETLISKHCRQADGRSPPVYPSVRMRCRPLSARRTAFDAAGGELRAVMAYHFPYQLKGDISMRKLLIFLLIAPMVVISACSQDKPEKRDNLVFVEGGTFQNNKYNNSGKSVALSNFYINKYEVVQKEWVEVMGSNPLVFIGDSLPVEMVSWYDVVEYCNQRGIREGLKPYYNIDKDNKRPD